MVIEVGVGSGGKDMELVVMEKMLQFQQEVVALQGGLNGPLVTADNAYNLLKRFSERAGFKAPEQFWSNPTEAPPQQPQPDPEMLKLQADAKASEAKAQADMAKVQSEMQKLQVENEWVKLEAQKTVFTHQSNEKETAARERNDQLKIEMDARKADADVKIKLMELELKKAELGMKERELGHRMATEAMQEPADPLDREAKALANEKTRTEVQKTRYELDEKANGETRRKEAVKETNDQQMQAILAGFNQLATMVNQLAEHVAAPVEVERDPVTGRVKGARKVMPVKKPKGKA
jgi:hypothetical protein